MLTRGADGNGEGRGSGGDFTTRVSLVSKGVLTVFRRRDRSVLPMVRSVVWLALLVAVAMGAGWVLRAHQSRVRGIPEGFPAPVRDADVPTLGVNVALGAYGDGELAAVLGRLADDGFVWVRQSFVWHEIERHQGERDWSAPDRMVAAVRRFPELKLVAVLEDDPAVPPENPDRFAAFAAAFAERYGDHVAAYQIWDEPNLAANWGGGPVSPAAYADLLARTGRAIRAADPEALILLAGLAPTTETGPENLSEVRYLERLYEAGAGRWFDMVAAKAYGFDSGPGDSRVDESVLNFSRVLLLRQMMVEHGDEGKAMWVSHWGWNALPEGWDGPASIWGETDEATQASWTAAALERARREWPWVGAMIIENLQAGERDDPRWGFSLLDRHGSPRPVYNAVVGWWRSLPDAAGVGGYGMDSSWAAYEGAWRVGPLGADPGATPLAGRGEARASLRFEGTRIALTVRRGPYRGFLTATVDGEPANALPRDEEGRAYVVLYDGTTGLATVPLATGLEPGVHRVEVTMEGGEGQWPLIDWRVGATRVRDGLPWKLSGLALVIVSLAAILVVDVRRADWTAGAERFLAWPEWGQTAVVAVMTGLFWGAASLTWGRGPTCGLLPTTCLLISVVVLPVMVLLFALRLDLGLAMVAFCAPFYLVPEAMLYRALGMPETLVLVCALAYGVSRVLPRPPSHRGGPYGSEGLHLRRTDHAVGLLVAAAVLASAAADDRVAALFELRTVFLVPAVTYGVLRVAAPDEATVRRIMDGLVLGGLGVAVVGLAQLAVGRNLVMAEGGLPRLQSVYHSPNNVGLYLGRVWPMLAAVAVRGRGRRRRLYGVALVPVMAALVLSFSRGALLLGLPAAILVMGWLAGGRFRRLALVLVLVVAVALIPLLQVPRFATLLDLGRGTTFFRLQLWRSSLQMIRERPFFGVGPGNFLDAYRTRYVLPAAWEEFNLEHAHNIVLDHWTRLGLLGVVAGLSVQMAFWRRVRRGDRRDPLTLGMAGGMAALLAHGLVDNAVFFPDLALLLFLTVALIGDDGGDGDGSTDGG
ncbi:MAG: O-antigen ligase family protein [Chloroflexota bacterium]